MLLKKKPKPVFLLAIVLIIFGMIFLGIKSFADNNVSKRKWGELQYGAWIGSWPTKDGLADFQKLQERHLDVVNMFVDWKTNFSAINENFDVVYANQSIVTLTWEAYGLSNANIRDGQKDDYIRGMARNIKDYNKEVIIRLFHEGNGNWYSWAVGDSQTNTNETYIAAYRHVVDIFREEGATNVKWEYNVNVTNVGNGTSFLGHYPGDDYIDIISIDGYNWGTTQNSTYWKSFDEIFSDTYNELKVLNKPMAISEFASTEIGGNKGHWYKDAYTSLRSNKYSSIKYVLCFNENKETDWRIDSSEAALKGFREAIKK